MATLNDADDVRIGAGQADAVYVGSTLVWSAVVTYPLSFTQTATSPSATNLGTAQGVAVDATGSVIYGTAGNQLVGSDGRSVVAYDATYTETDSENFAASLTGYSQVNGISYDRTGGRLFIGSSNYPTTPKLGQILEVDPATLTLIDTHDVGANHSEGGSIRPGTDEFWAVFHDTDTFRRYDTTTGPWTLSATYTGPFFGVATADTYYQSLVWWSATVFMCPLHKSQTTPDTIDVFEYDPATDVVRPLYRLERPSTESTQGFDLTTDKTKAYFAERDGGGLDVHRVVEASIQSSELIDATTNPASSQLTGLSHWYPVMRWDGTSAVKFMDEVGTDHAVATSGAFTYPVLGTEGARWVHFRGGSGSRLEFGNLFPTALTEYTISFWYHHLSEVANMVLLNGDAGGTNIGDWLIQANRTNPGRIYFQATAVGATTARGSITATGDALTLGDKALITITQSATTRVLYLNGTARDTDANTSQISGASQDVYAGAFFTGSGETMRIRDLRIAASAMTSTEVAALYAEATRYDAWS